MVNESDIEKIRKKLAAKVGKKQDPHEFRPAKAKPGEIIKYRFYVLPPFQKGDKVFGGIASRDMDLFFIQHGMHWVNKKPAPCPRIFQNEECELCATGFALLEEIPKSEKDKRSAVIKQWLSQSNYAVNIYFPPIDPNPEELRDKVLWTNGVKACFDHWYAAIQRNDGGDVADPEAFGVFYDPYNAFMYQMVVKSQGDYNDYKSSKFIANIGSHPIAMLKDKQPDEAKIQSILDNRHDIFLKIGTADPKQIHKLYEQMLHGVDDDAGDEIPPTTPDDAAPPPKAPPVSTESKNKPADVPASPPADVVDDLSAEAPVTKKADPVKPAAKKSDPVAAKPEPVKPAAAKPEPVKPAAKKPDPVDDDDDDDVTALLAKLQSEDK